MKTWRDAVPWAPTTLIKDWARIRDRGRCRFCLHYGLLRVAPVFAAPIVGIAIGQGLSLSWTRWLAFAAIYTVIGTIWGLATWRSCERRWSSSGDAGPADR